MIQLIPPGQVIGVTSMSNSLFVARQSQQVIEVYDTETFELQGHTSKRILNKSMLSCNNPHVMQSASYQVSDFLMNLSRLTYSFLLSHVVVRHMWKKPYQQTYLWYIKVMQISFNAQSTEKKQDALHRDSKIRYIAYQTHLWVSEIQMNSSSLLHLLILEGQAAVLAVVYEHHEVGRLLWYYIKYNNNQ